MDSTIFQLYSQGEILARLGQTLQSGCLHVFTSRESANVFFKDGMVVAASRGLYEGEEVIKQILEWQEARMVWLANEPAPSSFKVLMVNILDHVQTPKTEEAGTKSSKPQRETSTPSKPASSKSTPRPAVFIEPPAAEPTPTKAKPILPAPTPAAAPVVTLAPAILKPIDPGSSTSPLTATKSIGQTAQARSVQEEALIQKYKLVLIHSENPALQLKVVRASSLIGRNPACDITINHASVSRQHCLLHLTERGLHVKDLGTTNGTKVNGIVLTEGYVSVGDKLTIGHEVFVLGKDPA